MKKILLSILAMSFSQVASAEEVFSCLTDSNKLIKLEQKGDYLEYSYGKQGNPELVFKNKAMDVYQRSKNSNWYEVFNMKNGAYIYSITYSHDISISRSSVQVTKNDKLITDV